LIENILSGIILWIKDNDRKFFGGLIGFFIAIFILTIGFFRTLFIMLCTSIGYFIGARELSKEDIKDILERILSHIKRD
jgi:uncharacterized membrane protein